MPYLYLEIAVDVLCAALMVGVFWSGYRSYAAAQRKERERMASLALYLFYGFTTAQFVLTTVRVSIPDTPNRGTMMAMAIGIYLFGRISLSIASRLGNSTGSSAAT